ncbi:MAG: hypothetical protein ACWGHO_05770 [Candidatus Moraniibacteriota bacterium]
MKNKKGRTAIGKTYYLKAILVCLFCSFLFFASDAQAETRTKTVEYFLGQNQSSGTGVAANTYWSPTAVTIDLPDAITSANAIKSAWVDFTFQTAATTAPGVVTIGLTPSGMTESVFTSASYLASGENYMLRVKPNFTSAVASRFTAAGAYSFSFRARVAGVATKMASAKLFITYDYDSQAAVQLNTVKYMIGQNNGNVAVGATGVTFTSPNLSISESAPTVVSAWAEIRGQIPATGTTDSTFAINYDSDSASNYYLDNAGSTDTQSIYILHPKSAITLNATHTLKIAATTGYQMNLISAEQIITYKFNYANSTTLTQTRDIILGSNGLKASSAALDVNDTINIPEDSPNFKNIFLRGTAHSAKTGNRNLAAQLGGTTPTPTLTFAQTAATETMNNFWILSSDVNDLSAMTQGDNQIATTFAGTMTSRASQLVLTYSYSKNSASESGSALFWTEQQTAYGTTGKPSVNVSVAGTTQSGSWDSYIWANSVNGVTVDRLANISTQPTGTTAYNWDSTGEYQWILFFHRNISGEIAANGSYTANLGSTGNNVMAAITGVSYRYITVTGSLAVDIVDAGGASVASPSVSFSSANFNWGAQQSTATMGIPVQKIRVTNTTTTPSWTLSIAGTVSTNLWTSGGNTYDFNGDATTGRLNVNASGATVTPQGGCTTTGLTNGSSAYFIQSTQDSINLITAGASAGTNCYWDITGVNMTQDIPAAQLTGSYSLNLILTVI